MTNKLEKGQKVLVAQQSRFGKQIDLEEKVVTKVGRIYFETEHGGKWRIGEFNPTDSRVGSYNNTKVYASLENYQQAQKATEIFNKIKRHFDVGSSNQFTYEQMAKVAEILGVDIETK